ncbi:MAG: hypothetical protein HF978_14205 [Desulfobacteraceae bacterium]|nr:hypothetical protein [Desulfobacteraceae bacterium]MBC2756691.1 hypothetical protein [Desulfobacteraceae bacterium]
MPTYNTKTRGKIKVPALPKERVQSWRDKKKKSGGKSLTVWLDAESVKQLDELLFRFPRKNKSSLVVYALKTLFEQETASSKAEI